MKHADVIIVGAGVIGAATAYELSRTLRARIVVFDRDRQTGRASRAAAGVLAVASAQARKGALLELRRRSASMFPSWVAALQEETGIDVGYGTAGLLSVVFSDADLNELAELVAHRRQQGMQAQLLDRREICGLEPGVAATARGGALFPEDRCIDNRRFLDALLAGASARGVELRFGTPVRAMRATPGDVCVQTDSGSTNAGTLIVAAGCWSTQLLGDLGIRVPVRPVEGEMLAVRASRPLHHILTAGDTYLVPRRDEVIVGSTTRVVGFDARVRAGGVRDLLAGAAALAPGLAASQVLRWWSGLRPCATIRRPIISRLDACKDLILATGHHRNGILLAPMTAALVRSMVTGDVPDVPLKPFGYRRR